MTVLAGLAEMARSGFTAVHEAGVDRKLLTAYQSLERKGELPVCVYVMLSARDPDLCREWIARGPTTDPNAMLVVRSVKVYYDGSPAPGAPSCSPTTPTRRAAAASAGRVTASISRSSPT